MMRAAYSFIFLVAAISRTRVAVTSAANLFEAEAAGGEIDYLEATSDFVEADVVGGGIDNVEATSYHAAVAGTKEGAYGVSDASVKAVAKKNMFSEYNTPFLEYFIFNINKIIMYMEFIV